MSRRDAKAAKRCGNPTLLGVLGALAVAAAASAAMSCEQTTFEPASKVDTLRVLAVRADSPFATPGQRVHIDALVADPKGQGRAVQVAWGTCVNPGSGEVTACGSQAGGFAVSGASFDLTVPSDALANPPTDYPVGVVGVVFAACGGGTFVSKRTDTAPVTCVDASGATLGRDDFMWGDKRIVTVPFETCQEQQPSIACQHNPTIHSVDLGARAIASGQSVEAIVTMEPGSAETYLDPRGSKSTEDLVAFFYASGGVVRDGFTRFDASGATRTVVAVTDAQRGTTVNVWVVVRDDRGGMDWQERDFVVAP